MRNCYRGVARLLLCAILSDTLNLQSVTTTDADRLVVTILAVLGNLYLYFVYLTFAAAVAGGPFRFSWNRASKLQLHFKFVFSVSLALKPHLYTPTAHTYTKTNEQTR